MAKEDAGEIPGVMKPGHCTNCGVEYEESVMLDGKIVRVRGPKVLGHEQPGVLSTNYTEIYLLLSDFTITRLSLCSICRVAVNNDMLAKCWGELQRFMQMISWSASAWHEAEKWKKLGWVSWHNSDEEARAAQDKARNAAPVPGVQFQPKL